MEYGLIQDAGKLDAPGRPVTYKTTDAFLKMFGYSSLNELPELPKYKIDENEQIVIEDIIQNSKENEAPSPEREKENLENIKLRE